MALPLLEQHADAQQAKRSLGFDYRETARLPRWSSSKMEGKSDLDPSNDLESFTWVMLYALCVKEMDAQDKTSRDSYRKDRFIPIFGAISFEDTYRDHLRIRNLILNSNKWANTWRASHIGEEDAWTALQTLMDAARKGNLNHAMFKNILEEYIGLLKPMFATEEPPTTEATIEPLITSPAA